MTLPAPQGVTLAGGGRPPLARFWGYDLPMPTPPSTRTQRAGRGASIAVAALALAAAALPMRAAAQGSGSVVYRCPGNVYTSDRDLSRAQAEQRGCKVIEGAPVTIVETVRPNPPPAAASAPTASATRPPQSRVDPAQQRTRDDDRRRILADELAREQQRLAELQREYNNGQPERLGSERNYQKYLDRVAEMKAGLARKEADVAALRRELDKLPPP